MQGSGAIQPEVGSLNGTYDFLERFAECRFFFPGEYGTVIPVKKELVLPELDISDRPDWLQRRILQGGSQAVMPKAFQKDFRRRFSRYMRTETLQIPNCHGLAFLDFVPRFAQTHPEYFALDSKKRVGYYAVSTALFMGSSAVMYATTLFVSFFKQAGFDAITSWRLVFTIFAVVGMACLVASAFAFKENDYVKTHATPQDSIWKSFAIVFKNKNFVIFTIGDLASYISMAFFQSAMLYYITTLLGIKESQSFIVMAVAIAVAICSFPLIVKISKKYNKKLPLMIGSIIFAVVFALIYFGDNIASLMPGLELIIGIVMGLAVAFPFAAINILPQSIVSDIIQEDSLQSGINREGIFSATKTFIEKIAYAIAMVIVSSVLAIGAQEGEEVGLLGVKLTGVFACVFTVISIVFFKLYDDKKVTENIEKLKGNIQAEGAVEDVKGDE